MATIFRKLQYNAKHIKWNNKYIKAEWHHWAYGF